MVTITTVGYGEYYTLTSVGRVIEYYTLTSVERVIAVLVMLSGIGIVVIIVTIFSQRRLKSIESWLKLKTEFQPRLFGDETKTALKDKIDGIENLTEEDFDTLIITMKSLRRTLLEESKNLYKCSRCGNVYYSKPKICSNCGLELT